MKLLIVDSNSILNRGFYGVRPLTTKEGIFTNGIFGFFGIFLKLESELKPDMTAFAFDLSAPTFRHKMYADYKGNRKGMPDELGMQLPFLKDLITALGYPIVELEGYEADDILGTLGKRCSEAGQECYIASGDRDMFQLVDNHVTVVLASSKGGKAEYIPFTPEAIQEKYGVTPRQMIDVKALMGDSSDNIPGVAGVGEKTALDLIQKFKSLDGVYSHLDADGIRPAVKKKLEAGKDSAYLSYRLAEINQNSPVPCSIQDLARRHQDKAKVYSILNRLEMYTLVKRFGLSAEDLAQGQDAIPDSVKNGEPSTLEIKIVPNPLAEDISKILEAFSKEEALSLLVLFHEDRPEAFGFSVKDTVYCIQEDASERLSVLLKRAQELHIPIQTHNCKSLYRFAMLHDLELGEIAFDSALAAYLLSPNSTEYPVDKLLTQYPVSNIDFKGEIPEGTEGFAKLCGGFPELCRKLSKLIQNNEQEDLLHTIEIPLSEVLASMEQIGFELDTNGIAQFGKTLGIDIADLQKSIWEDAGYEFNINSPKQLGEVLFIKLGLPSAKKTKSGYSTNAEVLDGLRGQHPIIEKILQFRQLTKLKSTYVEGLLKVVASDGRVHSSFNQTETRTGRISSAEPNMQNIPVRTELGSNLRKFFRAKDDCLLVDADYSQIELRVLASISKDQNMIDAFQNGEDIHTTTASQVFNQPPLFVTPLMRSRAKAVNFGIVYGISAFSLSNDIGVSVSEADQYIKNYLKTYSGVRKYMEETKELARKQGYVTTLFHRRRYLPELAASNRNTRAFGERVAMNTPIQGTAADIIKIAMVRVYHRLKKDGLKSRLLLQIHDELIVEAPIEEAEQVKVLLKEEMEDAVHLAVPMEVAAKTGKTWYESK